MRPPTPPAAPEPGRARGDARILAALDRRQCKFALDDPGPGRMEHALFCAAPTGEGEIYCPGHKARCLSGKVLARVR